MELVLVESADEYEFGIIAKRLSVKLGDVATANDSNVHAALLSCLIDPPILAHHISTFLKAATMSCMSAAVPRKTSCAIYMVSEAARSAIGVDRRRKYWGRRSMSCRIAG